MDGGCDSAFEYLLNMREKILSSHCSKSARKQIFNLIVHVLQIVDLIHSLVEMLVFESCICVCAYVCGVHMSVYVPYV